MDGQFMFDLQCFRMGLGEPVIVNSGYRCAEHNAAVGGVKDSQHLAGKAVDVLVRDSAHRHKVVAQAVKNGFKGIGIAEDFVHIDDRPGAGPCVMWVYPAHVTAAKKR
jgi:zinc D-Ala-D-Ala carboxypeptidase